MTKRKSSVRPDLRKVVPDKQYRGVHGKVVDWAEHAFEEGWLYIHARFTDKTELCWTVSTAIVIREADLSDWKTGDFKQLRVFVKGETSH